MDSSLFLFITEISKDIDECAVLSSPCGKQAICENAVPGYNCRCPQGYAGQPTPDVACEQVMMKRISNSFPPPTSSYYYSVATNNAFSFKEKNSFNFFFDSSINLSNCQMPRYTCVYL
jgi:hypothetical protein